MSDVAIEVAGLRKSFGRQEILRGVDVRIASGESLVVLGPSGSGKTTLLRLIAGLEAPDGGEIRLHGARANEISPQERNLGVVFQEHALFQRMTVRQNIAFGLKVRGKSKAETERTVDEMLELVRLEAHAGKLPSQLSGGQRQRVAVARALAFRPEAMLFDEPFSALDAVTRTDLRREVRQLLRSMNVPALFITHDQEEALELADCIAVLNVGQIEQIGTPFDVYNHPKNEFVATFLGAANVLLGRWRSGEVAVGLLRMKAPPSAPDFAERQPVKIVFRPEDVVVNFQRQLLNTPFVLGTGTVEDVSYVGPTERLVVRIVLFPRDDRNGEISLVGGDMPVTISRTKWEASEMELSPGDSVVIGLKDYRILPHYPLGSESGAKVIG
jgi:ABC-type Fe3+/spermidine/putrescine transport system ATPase subunit